MITSQTKSVILWILLVFCYFIHGYYHLAELFFGMDIKVPDASGKVPTAVHIFSSVVEILPLAIGLATLYINAKWFRWIGFILAIIFVLLNIVHLVQTVFIEPDDIRQVVLLSFIVVLNLVLIKETNKHRKYTPEPL